MSLRSVGWLAFALQLIAAGCDDPAPTVLGRLQVVADAGSRDAALDDEEAREHERESHERDEEDDDLAESPRN
jgi:hypothetical protein